MPRLPFLGGPISAILVGLCLEPFQQRVLPWFALVPLFLSLERHQGRPWARFAHGASFGLVLGAVGFPWLYRGELDDLVGGPFPIPAIQGILSTAGGSAALAIQTGLFALGSGILLRGRRPLILVGGLAGLWAGTEILRGWLAPAPWAGGWCLLGYAVRPETLQGQLASVVGVYGLGLAVALSNALFLAVLRDSRLTFQIAFAAMGVVVPLLCRTGGGMTVPQELPERSLSVLVAACRGGDVESLVDLSSRLGQTADIVTWPRVHRGTLGGRAVGDAIDSPPIDRLLQETGAYLVASAEDPGGNLLVVLDPRGRVAFVGVGSGAVRAWTFELPAATIGLILAPRRETPGDVRGACVQGAAAIVVTSAEAETGGRRAFLQRSLVDRVRAIENRRWVVRTGEGGAIVANPLGGVDLEVRGGLEAAGVEDIGLSTALTPYARVGWWLEPCCAIVAVGTLTLALVAGIGRR